MTDLANTIADAIARAEFGYSMELTRLVDGVSTYTLTYNDGEKHEFGDTDDVYAHVAQKKRRRQAEEVLRALDRLDAPAEGDGWQPIETAPKDGVDILVFCADTLQQFACFWTQETWQYAVAREGYPIVCRPTHWHPLPAPPRLDAAPARQDEGGAAVALADKPGARA